jgi:hypothetical protein
MSCAGEDQMTRVFVNTDKKLERIKQKLEEKLKGLNTPSSRTWLDTLKQTCKKWTVQSVEVECFETNHIQILLCMKNGSMALEAS